MPSKTHIPMNRVMSTVEYKNMRFVVFDAPTDANLDVYLDELKTRNVSDIIRVCEPTYSTTLPTAAGLHVTDYPFPDGTIPPPAVVSGFLNLCNDRFPTGIAGTAAYTGDAASQGVKAIGVHCVAGLGRAPILVAIALIESGMTPIDAVEYVRTRRRGAFNTVQLNYLVNDYKRSWKKGVTVGAGGKAGGGFSFGFKKERSASPTGSAEGVVAEGGAAAKSGGFKSWFSKK
ncbi:Protein tyrosine phosphatase type IVA 1 [Podochytrium sp. JEL0797]|nr:Protein tyrosine phosphatase type IVA 1 [Podochytrium sp. JEL0797]